MIEKVDTIVMFYIPSGRQKCSNHELKYGSFQQLFEHPTLHKPNLV